MKRESNEAKLSNRQPSNYRERKSDRRYFAFTHRASCLRLCPNGSADCGYRNTLVRFIKRRGIIELRHFRLTRVMQRDDAPVVFVEHRTTGASSFGRCPVVHAAIATRDHDVVVKGERKPASAGVADDVQPPSLLTWRRHR